MPNDALQQFYNSFRIPQQGQPEAGPTAPQMGIPQITPAKQSVNPAGQVNQMIENGRGGNNTANYAGGAPAGGQGPITGWLQNNVNTPLTQYMQGILQNGTAAGTVAGGTAGSAAAGGAASAGGGIMSMLASLL